MAKTETDGRLPHRNITSLFLFFNCLFLLPFLYKSRLVLFQISPESSCETWHMCKDTVDIYPGWTFCSAGHAERPRSFMFSKIWSPAGAPLIVHADTRNEEGRLRDPLQTVIWVEQQSAAFCLNSIVLLTFLFGHNTREMSHIHLHAQYTIITLLRTHHKSPC